MNMRFFSLKNIITFMGILLGLSSCIKEEAPNAEADILSCEVEGNLLIREPVISNHEVKLYANSWNDLSAIAPRFTLTQGATIVPESGTIRDFSSPQTYTVTSEDRQWKKTYTVKFITSDIATEYHFEHIRFHEYGGRQYFHIFYDYTVDGEEMTWGSGNTGFLITNSAAPAEDYPTCQSENGYQGKCAKLTTRSTGFLGKMFKAPLAAGNLFTGTFEINMANMAKSTRFGTPFRKTPLALTGYYKYIAGETLTDKNSQKVPDQKDECDIYAVLYEVTHEVPYLDGTNIKTHPNIVMIAQLPQGKQTEQWKRFSLPFSVVEGRKIEPAKLQAGKYNLAIVMTSSKGGAQFLGAVGSTLYVDEMQLFYQ